MEGIGRPRSVRSALFSLTMALNICFTSLVFPNSNQLKFVDDIANVFRIDFCLAFDPQCLSRTAGLLWQLITSFGQISFYLLPLNTQSIDYLVTFKICPFVWPASFKMFAWCVFMVVLSGYVCAFVNSVSFSDNP